MDTNYIYLTLDADAKAKAIEAGDITLEALMEAEENYNKFLDHIEEEFTPQKIRDYLLARKRNTYAFYTKRLKELERDNNNARRSGMSFTLRTANFTSKIKTLEDLLVQTKEQGNVLKRSPLNPARVYLGPMDVDWVQDTGFLAVLDMKALGT